jgi:hypothetical protein
MGLLTKFTMFNPAPIYVLCHLYLHFCLELVAVLAYLAFCAQVSQTVDYVGSLCVIEYTVGELCVLKFLSFWQNFYNCYCVSVIFTDLLMKIECSQEFDAT